MNDNQDFPPFLEGCEPNVQAPVVGDVYTPTRSSPDEVARLYAALDLVNSQTNPRTAQLLEGGSKRIAQKVIEEAGEVALEAIRKRPRAAVRESADLVYHLVVLWRACDIRPDDVWQEMRRREQLLGLAEKLPKGGAGHPVKSLV